MTTECVLQDLIRIGRRILHERRRQELCDVWRRMAYDTLCDLVGPRHEYAMLFQDEECCEIKTLLRRAAILSLVKDMVVHGQLPISSKTEPPERT